MFGSSATMYFMIISAASRQLGSVPDQDCLLIGAFNSSILEHGRRQWRGRNGGPADPYCSTKELHSRSGNGDPVAGAFIFVIHAESIGDKPKMRSVVDVRHPAERALSHVLCCAAVLYH
jgi:hypothetical protein